MRVFAKLFLLLFCSSVWAQYYVGPVASGMGGASLGAGSAAEGHLFNPAVLVHGEAVEIAGYYSNGMVTDSIYRNLYGVTLASNDPGSSFPGALSFFVTRKDLPGLAPINEQFLQFSVAEFVLQHFSVGISGIRLAQQIENQGNLPAQWNGVIGALYNPFPDLGVGLSYAYFVHPSSSIPAALRLDPTLGLGLHYLFFNIVRFRADVLQVQQPMLGPKYIFKGGIESSTDEFLIVRFGVRRDEAKDNSVVTAGLAFDGPKLKIDYSFEKGVSGFNGIVHSVDLRLPF